MQGLAYQCGSLLLNLVPFAKLLLCGCLGQLCSLWSLQVLACCRLSMAEFDIKLVFTYLYIA